MLKHAHLTNQSLTTNNAQYTSQSVSGDWYPRQHGTRHLFILRNLKIFRVVFRTENDGGEKNLVIRNQADLEKYISCHKQLPGIDFEKYFLLAGRYRHNNCAIFHSQSVSVCNDQIVYNVDMLEQACHAITSVFTRL